MSYNQNPLNFSDMLSIKNILIYLLVMNLIAFFMMGIDKFKAKKQMWRIPEGTLIMSALLGGSIGGIIGMYTFHHKTKKLKFSVGIPTILVMQIGCAIYLMLKYYNIV